MNGPPEAFHLAIGKRLRRRRRELGMTQEDVGRRAGLSYQQVQRFERGETQIPAAMVWRLAGALGLEISYLFGETDTAEPAPRPAPRPLAAAHNPAPPQVR